MKTLVVNVSGGKSSGMMVDVIVNSPRYADHPKLFIFCNTGCEHPKTLEFVNNIDKHYSLNLVWLEAEPNRTLGKGTDHKIVNFDTASRNGEPFEKMIEVYGIPNQSSPHCTRELKTNTSIAYLRSLGLANKDMIMAMGFRADEPQRAKAQPKIQEVYPLMEEWIDKTDVNMFWEAMPFNLSIREEEGNCVFCWKKSDLKHFNNIIRNPQFYDFPDRMEQQHSRTNVKDSERFKRTFFRNHRSTRFLREEAKLIMFDMDGYKSMLKQYLTFNNETPCTEECGAIY